MKRLSSLDYLRGLAAAGIMVFHYTMWTFGFFSAQDFLGRVGIYAVSVFYVLSGLTLYHVYYDKIGNPSKKGLAGFAIKRVFRIFPLLWLVSVVTLSYTKEPYTPQAVFMNFSGLFSLFHWHDTIAYGAWSIGNELVFYLFFPLFIFLSKRWRTAFFLFSLILFLTYLWFAFVHIDSSKTLADNWVSYTHPFNQVFLFLGGYLLGMLADHIILPKPVGLLLIAAGLVAFIFLPATGDSISLVTGFNRLAFSLICFVICFAFYKTHFGLPPILHRAFQLLGEISYSVYLIHPVAWHILGAFYRKYHVQLSPAVQLGWGFALSLLAAYAVYQLYEKFFMKLGKRIAARLTIC